MTESLLHRESQPRVSAHQSRHEMFGVLADVAPEVVVELVLPPHNLPQQPRLGPVPGVLEEGRVSTEHDVGDDSTGPQVLGPARVCLGDHLTYLKIDTLLKQY